MQTDLESSRNDTRDALRHLTGRYVENTELIVESQELQWLRLVGSNWHATIAAQLDDSVCPPLYVSFAAERETRAPGPEAEIVQVGALHGVTIREVQMIRQDGRDAVAIRLEGGARVLVSMGREPGAERSIRVLAEPLKA